MTPGDFATSENWVALGIFCFVVSMGVGFVMARFS